MTNLSFTDAAPILSEFNKKMDVLKPSPIFFYPYLARVLQEQYDKVQPRYPMTVNIAPENKYLLKGITDPAYTLTIEEPIRDSFGHPMWFESSAGECFLRFGYENKDPRFISSLKLDMEFIHAFLGGSSGHGKSVTINSMLASLFYEYAPWEVQVALSDAKIVEFKKYGMNHRIPHITTIAATSDADFVYSVLQKAYNEMNERGKIFGTLQCSNLKNFRKKYNLAYPRVIIVMDEVESTFKMAGKLAGKIADLIDGFARLGRAAGYHIFMATQNMSADIPKSAVGQIRVRLCLGANQTTSESVLGNDGATNNFGRIGMLIANTEVMNGGNTRPHNIEFQTPFLTDENFEQEMEELERLGHDVQFRSHLSFYDEEDIKIIDTFEPIIDKALARMSKDGELSGSNSAVVLGYPAFVSDDPDELLKIHLNQKDVENIVLCSTLSDHMGVLLRLISKSLSNGWAHLHYSSDTDMFQYTPKAMACVEARDHSTYPLNEVDNLIRKRLFLAYADNLVRSPDSVDYKQEVVEKIFTECKIPKEVWGNSLMCRRAVIFNIIQKDPTHKTMWSSVSHMFPNFGTYYQECVKYNAVVEPITVNKFSKVVYFIGDLSKIIGYGRDNNTKAVSVLKKAMQDSNRAGVLFVVYSRSMEGLNDLVSGMRYCIFDTPDGKDWGKMRTEAPPALSERLAVLYDSLNTQNPQCKFKRTLLREEF